MACTNCGSGTKLQPSKSNGGLYIINYIGDEKEFTLIGEKTGTAYTFGTKKKSFWANYLDIPGLFADQDYGTDLRSKVQ